MRISLRKVYLYIFMIFTPYTFFFFSIKHNGKYTYIYTVVEFIHKCDVTWNRHTLLPSCFSHDFPSYPYSHAFFLLFFLFHIETPTLDFTSNHKENSLNHPSFLEFSLYLFLQNYHFVLGFNKIFIERILPYFRYSNMQIIHHVNVARLSPKNLNAHHVIHFAIYTNGVILYMIHYHQEYSTFSTPSIIFHYYTCPF